MEYYVRDGMTNVTVTPQWSTNLTADRTGFKDVADLSTDLIEFQEKITNGVTPLTRVLVSVPIDSDKKKFLQLKIVRTLPPE